MSLNNKTDHEQITSAHRLPCIIMPFPSSPCVWQGFACYQLYGMTFRPVLMGCGLTGLVIISGKSKGDGTADVFASFEIFGTAACLRTAFPALTTGMSKRRLGSGASRARVSKSHPRGPSASTFYGNLFTASWFIPGAMTGVFHSASYFHQFIKGIKFKL